MAAAGKAEDAATKKMRLDFVEQVAEYASEARDAAGDLLDAEKDTRAAKRALNKLVPPPPEEPSVAPAAAAETTPDPAGDAPAPE